MEEAEPGAHLAAFAGWHPAVTEMIGAVPQSPRWGLFALPPLQHWNRGPVVLLGDAAHAMLPHHGQGANQTIEDAAVLDAALNGTDDLVTALRRYEVRRRMRTRQVQLVGGAYPAGDVYFVTPARGYKSDYHESHGDYFWFTVLPAAG